jgi:hypothetical protein
MDLGRLRELSEHRTCQECGAEFRTKQEDGREVPALEQFSDHLTVHQPTPFQWATAHQRIQAGRERQKVAG